MGKKKKANAVAGQQNHGLPLIGDRLSHLWVLSVL